MNNLFTDPYNHREDFFVGNYVDKLITPDMRLSMNMPDKKWYENEKYLINIDISNPLCLVRGTVRLMISESECISDYGSIPFVFHPIPSMRPKRFKKAYLTHDNPYKTHTVKICVCNDLNEIVPFNDPRWLVTKIRRCDMDRLLLVSVRCDGGHWAQARIRYRGVRLGGSWSWNKKSRTSDSN